MARSAVTIGFSVPPEVAAEVERMAILEGRSKSALFRDMFRAYSEKRRLEALEELSEYGRKRAQERGIRTQEDVERLIAEARGGS